MKKIWKPIPGFPHYVIDRRGNIKRVALRTAWGVVAIDRDIPSHVSKHHGYMQVRLIAEDGRYHYFRTHRLVALAFIGPPPVGRPECNHKNGIKTDNRVENLEYVSRSQNALHSTRVLGKGRGETHPRSKLTNRQVRQIREQHAKGRKVKDLARRYDISLATTYAIVRGTAWSHL